MEGAIEIEAVHAAPMYVSNYFILLWRLLTLLDQSGDTGRKTTTAGGTARQIGGMTTAIGPARGTDLVIGEDQEIETL